MLVWFLTNTSTKKTNILQRKKACMLKNKELIMGEKWTNYSLVAHPGNPGAHAKCACNNREDEVSLLSLICVLFFANSYLIFVNFGTPPHCLAFKSTPKSALIRTQKIAQIGRKRPKFCALCARKYTSLKKVHHRR